MMATEELSDDNDDNEPAASVSAPTAGGDSDGDDCAICMEPVANSADAARLDGCLHVFHLDHIGEWAKHSSQCPLCKRAFTGAIMLATGVLEKLGTPGGTHRHGGDDDSEESSDDDPMDSVICLVRASSTLLGLSNWPACQQLDTMLLSGAQLPVCSLAATWTIYITSPMLYHAGRTLCWRH